MRRLCEPAILSLLVLASCRIDGDYGGTSYACPDGRCPPGFSCVEGRCLAPMRDGAADALQGGDASRSPDASCACEPGAFADACQSGATASLDQARRAGGQTVCASTSMNGNDLLGCAGAPMPGADAVFRLALEAGETLSAELRPEGFDGALYLLTDCSSSQCAAVSDEAGLGGTESLQASAAETVDHYLAVDSGSSSGCYRLHVTVE